MLQVSISHGKLMVNRRGAIDPFFCLLIINFGLLLIYAIVIIDKFNIGQIRTNLILLCKLINTLTKYDIKIMKNRANFIFILD